MGKLGPRLSTKKKGKRWIKGQSSSSNPESKKFRNQALSRFFQGNLGSTSLTKDVLKKHDTIQGIQHAVSTIEIDETENSIDRYTFKTFNTFATDWSNCSNISFNRFLNHFQSNSVLHKQMLAVLAAVTDIIKQNNGTESSTEYYAALMSILKVAETDESISAILSLLDMGMKTVPKNVLKLQFSQASHIFLQILTKYTPEENFLIIRHCISCLSNLLRIQEISVWMDSSTKCIVDSILVFTIHSKPNIRKIAQYAIYSILKGSDVMRKDNSPLFHPAAIQVAKHCITQIEMTGQPGQMTSTLYILNLLKNIIHQLPKSYLKHLCEGLLSIMTLNNVLVTSCCFQTLHSLFLSKPTDSILPSQLNAQIINALYDYQPASGDTQPTLAWLAVMQEAHSNLAIRSPQLCAINISRIIEKCTELWLSDKDDVHTGTSNTIKALLEMCIVPICKNETLTQKYKPVLIKIICFIRQGMKYQYIYVWHHVINLISSLFKIIGSICQTELIEILISLAELRDSYNFSYNLEIEYAIGSAIKSLGPQIVLNAISLQTSACEMNLKRSWLLPILKNCISYGSLVYFIDNLLPLANYCEKQCEAFKENNDGIGAHSHELLNLQIWALLPSFCNNASDIKKNFKNIAKTLGIIINEKKHLRLSAMASLRKLIKTSIENNNQDDIEELSRFAKNYLPILFNLYTETPKGSDEEGHRLSCYETIKVYLKITNKELVGELFHKALENLSTSNTTEFVKESIFDILRVLCQFTDITKLKILYEKCVPLLLVENCQKEQKKAYRILEEIFASESKSCRDFLFENDKLIQKLIIKSYPTVEKLSKGVRIRCITHLIEKCPQLDKTKFLKAVIPEAIMGIKELNEKCRSSSYILLNTIAKKLMYSEDFEEYINILITGLNNTPMYCSASLLALSSIMYHYNGSMSIQIIQNILEISCSLVIQPTREIVLSALSFIKIYLSIMPKLTIAPTLQKIIQSLTSMTDDCERHFRQKVRDIITKLIRKFGDDIIIKIMPISDKIMNKRLRNIRKIEARKQLKEQNKFKKNDENNEKFNIKKKPKSFEEILADSDEDFDNYNLTEIHKHKLKKKTWIQENADNIIDFINPAAAKNILISKANNTKNINVKSKEENHGFEIAQDGRLIITDNTNVNNNDIKKKENQLLSESTKLKNDEINNDDMKSIKLSGLLKKKRKLSTSTESIISNTHSLKLNYKVENVGINRTREIYKKENKLGEEYRAKKAFGDIKRKGKVDPYVYVPLTRSALNRRKKINSNILKKVLSRSKKDKHSQKNSRNKKQN